MSPTLILRSVAVFAFAILLACDALAAVGTVQFAVGDVKIRDAAGKVRATQKGDAINEGDTILTGSNASAQLKMSDGGILAIRTDTELKIDTYRFAGKEDGKESALMSLLKGGFRTITGVIGRTHKDNYRVSTATATIGIRGTDHEPHVILAPAVGAPQPPAPPGTYDKVNVGAAFISSPLGTVNVAQNQVGFAAPNQAPTILPQVPGFFKATPSVQAAAPATKTAAATTTTEVRSTATVDNTPPPPPPPSPVLQSYIYPIPSPSSPPPPVQQSVTACTNPQPDGSCPQTGTAAAAPVSSLTGNFTNQTVGTSTGSTIPITQSTFAIDAQAAADAALVAANAAAGSVTAIQTTQTSASPTLSTINSLTAVSTSPASSAISTATSATGAAQTAVNNVNALSLADAALATSNASTSSSLASTAASRAALAQANAAGGFADAIYAVPANTATQSANTQAQTANTLAQTAAGDVTTQNALFTTARTDANTALGSANTQLTTANTQLGIATTNNSTLASAQSTASGLSSTINTSLTSAQSASSLAQQAAANAQAAATLALTLQNAGDLTGAQAALSTAQAELANAQNDAAQAATQQSTAQTAASGLPAQLTAAQNAVSAATTAVTSSVTAANSAQTSAGTATTQAATATTAQTTAVTAVTTTSTQLATVQSAANTVAANFLLAQRNNPAVATSNFSHVVLAQKPVTGGTEFLNIAASQLQSNTKYVLNENKDLIETRSSAYERFGFNPQAFIPDANIKFSGGVAKDHFQGPDSNVYMGRWEGGQIDVTDLATSGAVPPFSDLLGLTSAHWIVGLSPGDSAFSTSLGPINNVQQLIGTANYTLIAATHPTDAFGNVGTLNSASLTANFSSQTVNTALGLSFSTADPVNVSSRNLNLSASASNVPISLDNFSASLSLTSCTGGNCPPLGLGYAGSLFGAFGASASGGTTTGAVGTGTAVGYFFLPIPASITANQPFDDVIQGAAVLTTGTTPTVGTINTYANNANLRHEARYSVSAVGSSDTFATVVRNSINVTGTLAAPTTPATLTGPTTNTNYLFDASGNLVRIFDTPYVVFDHADNVAPTTTQFPAPTPLAHAQISFGGGSATAAQQFFDPNTGIRLGRWAGGGSGFVEITDLTTGGGFIDPLGNRSVQWVLAPAPASLPVTGVFHYTRINDASGNPSFATSPTDSYGNVGTLDRARLTVDFTAAKVSAGVAVTMPSGPSGSFGVQNLSGFFADAPILSNGFNVSSNPANNPANTDFFHVSCFGAGCAPNQSYGGRIRGGFSSVAAAADTADGAFYRYTFNTNYPDAATATANGGRVNDDYIDGYVAFQRGPAIIAPPTGLTGPSQVLTTYRFTDTNGTQSRTDRFRVENPSNTSSLLAGTTNLSTDASGNLLAVTQDDIFDIDENRALALSGGTPNPATPISAANGVTLGWREPSPTLTVSGFDSNNNVSGCFGTTGCTTPARTVLADGLAWVRGPAPYPFYLSDVLAANSNSSGTVTTGTATYTFSAATLPRDQTGASGTLDSASLFVNFNKQAVNFAMQATTSAGIWNANATGVRLESGEFSAFTGGGSGTIQSGPGITVSDVHRNLTVTLNSSSANTFGSVQGALMGPGLNAAGTTYALGTFGGSSVSGALAFSGPAQSITTTYRLIGAVTGMNVTGTVDSDENTAITGGFVSPFRTQVVNGFPVKFDGDFPVLFTPSGCTTCTANQQHISAILAVTGATGVPSIGTATIVDSGIDAATGIAWGRYANGTIGVTDRITGASLGTIDITQQNVHFAVSTNQAGPTVLPVSGTATYTMVGATHPTDNFGNVGTLNSASLTANFTAQTASAAVNATFSGTNPISGVANPNPANNTGTWSASATDVPIQNAVFQAQKPLGGIGNLTVTSPLGTNTAGRLIGGFTGSTGKGAALLYSLNHGGNVLNNAAAVTVSGVAVFKR